MRYASALFATILLSWPLVGAAHTHLEKSKPAEGAQLNSPPAAVELWFSGRVAAEWSHIDVKGPAGERVDIGAVSGGDDPGYLAVKLQPLAPGVYDVQWSVISGDGHRIKGAYSFTIE